MRVYDSSSLAQPRAAHQTLLATGIMLAVALGFMPSLSAQVISYFNGGAAVYEPYDTVVSATDAANQGISSFGSLTQTDGSAIFGSQLSILNDGIVFNPTTYGTSDRGNTTYSFTPSDGSVVVFAFTSPQSVGTINTFAMSGAGQLRSAQDYGLEYQSGGNWTSLFSNLNTSAAGNLNDGNTTTWVNLDFSGFSGGSLANVDALRFTFRDVDGRASMYREIDVVSVPEPSAWAIALGGVAAVLAFRCRARHQA
jgi:hypothetical protein